MFIGTIAGNIGKDDATLETTKGGMKYARFSVGVTVGSPKDKKTEWLDVTVWGAYGESIVSYATSGTPITLSGDLTAAPYIDKQGNARAGLRLKADKIKLQGKARAERPAQSGGGKPAFDQDLDDEIPF